MNGHGNFHVSKSVASAVGWLRSNGEKFDFVHATAKKPKGLVDPHQVGWRLGRAWEPRGEELWVPYDRTTIVIGAQGSGKTLDCLFPALLNAPGSAVVTLTKPEDLRLVFKARERRGPALVCDPYRIAPGLPELVWDPIPGCENFGTSLKRATAFVFSTVKAQGNEDGARYYAVEVSKVLQAYFHAAALAGKTMADVVGWVMNPRATSEPSEILLNHPASLKTMYGALQGSIFNDDARTTGNTISTMHQAIRVFQDPEVLRCCIPTPDRPAVNIRDMIKAGGTFFLLGRDEEYHSVAPYMTALAEEILDTAVELAAESEYGKVCPPVLACLDELPSTAPMPTLRKRMANERANNISFILACQTRSQLDEIVSERAGKTLWALSNVAVIFGRSNDNQFNKDISDLVGTVRVARSTYQTRMEGGSQVSGEDMTVLRPEEIRMIPPRHALVLKDQMRPVIAKLSRCIEGAEGEKLISDQAELRELVRACQQRRTSAGQEADASLDAARKLVGAGMGAAR